MPLGRLLEAGLPVAPRPVRQVGLVLAQLLLRHDGQQSGPQPVVGDVGIEQHGAEPAVALNDPVDGLALRLEHVVEAAFDELPIPVEELAVHVDGLVERVAPSLVQEAHQRKVAARGGHLAHPVGRRGPDAVEQDPLVVAVDPAHVDVQHVGRLDRFQPRQKPFHAPDRRARRAGLDAVQGRVRLVANGDQPVEAVAHRRRQTLRHALRQQGACLVPGRPHRTAQHRVGRRENVFVPKPASRPRQQRRRAVEPQRFVFEEPRQPFADGVVERAQTQVLTDALLMLGDRLLPAGVGVDRLGVGPQLQGREPQDLPVDLQGRLLGEPAEHTHEGDLVREAQPIVGAPSQGDLASVGLEEGGIADQAGAGDVGELGVSKTAIAKITGVSRTALYSFMSTRGLRPSP